MTPVDRTTEASTQGVGLKTWLLLALLTIALGAIVVMLSQRSQPRLTEAEKQLIGHWFGIAEEEETRFEVVEEYRRDRTIKVLLRTFYPEVGEHAAPRAWRPAEEDRVEGTWSFDGTEMRMTVENQEAGAQFWRRIIGFVRTGRWDRGEGALQIRLLVRRLEAGEKEYQLIGAELRLSFVRVSPDFEPSVEAMSLEDARSWEASSQQTRDE